MLKTVQLTLVAWLEYHYQAKIPQHSGSHNFLLLLRQVFFHWCSTGFLPVAWTHHLTGSKIKNLTWVVWFQLALQFCVIYIGIYAIFRQGTPWHLSMPFEYMKNNSNNIRMSTYYCKIYTLLGRLSKRKYSRSV